MVVVVFAVVVKGNVVLDRVVVVGDVDVMMYGVVVCNVVGHNDALDGLVVNDVVFTLYDDFVVLPAKKLLFIYSINLQTTRIT